MRKKLIVLSYFILGSGYGLGLVLMFRIIRKMTFESTFESMLNNIFAFMVGILIVLGAVAATKKKNREDLKDEIEGVVDYLIENTIIPFKKNVKRKEFWILQGYVLSRILTFFNKFFFMVYVIPVVLFMMDPSKEAGTFVINLVTLLIFVNVARIFLSGFESNWRRCIKQALHVAILVSTTRTLEKTYQSVKIVSTGDPEVNHELTLIIIVLASTLALIWIKKWILNSVEKDLTIDKNPTFDKATFGIPCYSFKKYRDLIKIDSINFHYQGFNDDGPHSWTTFVGYLRYGLLQFEMEKYPRIFSASIAQAMPLKKGTKQVIDPIENAQSPTKEVENDS